MYPVKDAFAVARGGMISCKLGISGVESQFDLMHDRTIGTDRATNASIDQSNRRFRTEYGLSPPTSGTSPLHVLGTFFGHTAYPF